MVLRPWWAAPTWPPQRQFAWVHTTALGRAVVPDVYWIDAGASCATGPSGPASPRNDRRVCRCSPRSGTSRTSAAGIAVPAVAAAGPEAITARGSLWPAT